MAQAVHFQATVEDVLWHDPDVASFLLRAHRRLPRFTPGQFVHLSVDPFDGRGFWPESRAFSVANAVSDRTTLRLTVSRKGPYTNRILSELQVGTVVWAKGPYGEFTVGLGADCPTVVLLAGGTGITPFCAFMDAALESRVLPVRNAILHYGAQSAALLVYRELADRCEREIAGFRAHYYVETPAADAAVRTGRLDLDRIVEATPDPGSAAFYLSGPASMIQSFRHRLTTAHRVPDRQVLIDAWE
jgi:glycine betaine catabolism B